MTTVGVAEGLSSAVGDELNELNGRRITRLTATMKAAESVSTGLNSANYTQSITGLAGVWTWDGTTTVLTTNSGGVTVGDWIELDADGQFYEIDGISLGTGPGGEDEVAILNPDELTIPSGASGSSVADPAVITLSTGTYAIAVANGQRFTALTGAAPNVFGKSGLVDTRDNSTQITLQHGLPESFTNISWQIYTEPDTTANVETTLDWDASGIVFIETVKYRYGSKTLSTLDDLEHWNGAEWLVGAKQEHPIQAEVLDYTRNWSAVDLSRRRYLVGTAQGDDLSVLGRRYSVRRPPELTNDELYRALVEAIAYVPRGRMEAIEAALIAVLGENNYLAMVDLSLSSPDVGSGINRPGKVYLARLNDNHLSALGKTFVEGYELVPLDSATQATIAASPIAIAGVRLADDPGPYRLIQELSGLEIVDETEIDDPSAGFSTTRIKEGDVALVLTGQHAKKRASISSVAAGVLTLGVPRGSVGETFEAGIAGKGVSIRIIRPVSNFRYYKPSAESYVTYPADTGTTQWTFVAAGTATEADATLEDTAASGQYLQLQDMAAADSLYYRHDARILPESYAVWDFLISAGDGTLSSGATDYAQAAFIMSDGERDIGVGMRLVSGDAQLSFFDTSTGGAIGIGTTAIDTANDEWAHIQIRKRARGIVELWRDGHPVATCPHATFASSTLREMSFGCFSTALSGAQLRIKQTDWRITSPDDLWNLSFPNGTTPGSNQRITDGDANAWFVGGDVGKSVRVRGITTPASNGSSALGEWIVTAVPSSDSVDVTGRTQKECASFDRAFPDRITIRGRFDAFKIPDIVGFQFEVLSGLNIGTYTISGVLDPEDLEERIAKFPKTFGATASPFNPAEERSFILKVSDPPAGGFATDLNQDWRLLPTFPADAGPVPFELVDAGSEAAGVLMFRQSLTTQHGIVTGELVAVERAMVRTAHVLDEIWRITETSPGVLTHYAFWLFDNWGFLRRVIDDLTAAGMIPDFDHLFVDETGPHILE